MIININNILIILILKINNMEDDTMKIIDEYISIQININHYFYIFQLILFNNYQIHLIIIFK